LVVTVRNRDRLTKWTSLGSGKTAYQTLYQNETVSDFTLAELETASNIKLSQTTATQEFKNGNLLLDDWLLALLADSPSTRLKELIAEYSLWLSELEKNGGVCIASHGVVR